MHTSHVFICQMFCPNRHMIMCRAFAGPVPLPDEVSKREACALIRNWGELVESKVVPTTCEVCGQGNFKCEVFESDQFATVDEATAYMARMHDGLQTPEMMHVSTV